MADNTIATSVDESVQSIEERLKALTEELSNAKKQQAEEREAKQREEFAALVGGPSDVVSALDLDWDALEEIGVVGFTLQRKPDADGGEPITSIEPVLKRAAAKAASTGTKSSGGGGVKRDLKALFEQYATTEDRQAMDELVASGADGNKVWALRNKVATNAGFPAK